MTFKLARIFYFILMICTFLWNQQAPSLTQKIAVENSYRDKVVSAVSRLLGQENFIIIVNVEFSTVGGTLKKSGRPQARQGASNSYTPIPGLPTVPSRDRSLSGTMLEGEQLGRNNYSIARVEVDVNLNKELATADIKQEIKALIKKTIPEIRECEDCIKIESLGFLPIEKSKEIQALQKEIADLRSERRQAEEEVLIKELQDAEERLNKLKNEKEKSDEKIKTRDEELERRDALAHARLVEFEKSRNKQDSIRNINTENELRQVRDSRIHSDSTLLSKTIDIVEKQAGSNKEESLLGGGGSGIMSSVIFILLIICLMIVTFLAARNKKPNAIYLKPKGKNIKKTAETNDEISDNSPAEAPLSPAIRRDEDIARSELRSLRQTAVSLSIGEKENASALIKEWLEDNPNKGENLVEE